MARFLCVLICGAFLAGCGASYQITKECFDENPLPTSMQVGQWFGILGMGGAYLADGSSISKVNDARTQCIHEKKAELEAQQH